MSERVISSASSGGFDCKVELVQLADLGGDEVFRLYLAPDCTVDVPTGFLASMLNAGRSSYTLPMSLFGDTAELVQRLDNLLDRIPACAREVA
jgi:ubiquinone biosynthesis protein UbiJ